MFDSLALLRDLPDELKVYPGHALKLWRCIDSLRQSPPLSNEVFQLRYAGTTLQRSQSI